MKTRVTVLDKPEGEIWSAEEIKALIIKGKCCIEGVGNRRISQRIAIMSGPINKSISEVLGHSNFTLKVVDYNDRLR